MNDQTRWLMLSTITAISLLIDLYFWQALRHILKKKRPLTRRLVFVTFWGISAWIIALSWYVFFAHDVEQSTKNMQSAVYFSLYLAKLIGCIFLLLDDMIRGIQWIYEKLSLPKHEKKKINIGRKDFLVKTSVVAAGAPMILMARGVTHGAYNYQVRQIPLKIPSMPAAFKGKKFIQISDIHSGSWSDKEAVAAGIQKIMNIKPDAVFFTGDLVNTLTEEVYPWMDVLSEIKAPMGVFSTLGNHDYGDYFRGWNSELEKEKNLKEMHRVHADLGWKLLRNEHITLNSGPERINLVGVENWGKGRFSKYGDLEKAMKNLPDSPVTLLLSHDPSHWDAQVRPQFGEINVMLAGHTHGAQFGFENNWIRWSPSQYIYKQWAGLYTEEKQHLYVNRGFGFIGFPGRVGIMPEITVFELV